MDEDYIEKYSLRLKECSIVGVQFEVSLKALLKASEICLENNIKFVLNPSPVKKYPIKLFNNSTFVIVNEIEILNVKGYDKSKPYAVLKKYPNKLILTKGGEGAFYFDGKEIINIPAIKIKVIDTTGAGDTFLGSFMVAINNNMAIKDAITFANICAGLKTTKLGAQTGMPKLDEVKTYVKKNNINLNINF